MNSVTSVVSLLRIGDVCQRTGLSRAGIYQRVREGQFPAPRKLGTQSVGWRSDEIATWIDGRPASGPRGGAA